LEESDEACGEFHLEKSLMLAERRGVDTETFFAPRAGVRAARDDLLLRCRTPYVWFLDDDVVPQGSALLGLVETAGRVGGTFGFINGAKVDVANDRGYPDWLPVNPKADLKDWCLTNALYEEADLSRTAFRSGMLDTGHALLNLKAIKRLGLNFTDWDPGRNVPGEDTLFGWRLLNEGLEGWFAPNSLAWHLSRTEANFSGTVERRIQNCLVAANGLGFSPRKNWLPERMRPFYQEGQLEMNFVYA